MNERPYQCPYCEKQLRVDNAIVEQLRRSIVRNGRLSVVLAHIANTTRDEQTREFARMALRDGLAPVLRVEDGAEHEADAGADRGGAKAGE